MAHYGRGPVLVLFFVVNTCMAITCPGFPGYCSESFPGQTCNVVCARGRNNVPLCQEDGTWTDLPRCVEHDPGTEEQIAGLCPGISGYCSQSFYDGRCNFKCRVGPNINSVCTHDGTWEPYPTCQDDLRETQDGCDSCPGPLGDKRNRTAEAILNREASNLNNRINHNRVPKAGSIDSDPISNNGQRKSVPSFAGFQKFGKIRPTGSSRQTNGNALQRFPSQQNNDRAQRRPTQQSFISQQNNVRAQGRPTQQSFISQQINDRAQGRPTQQSFISQQNNDRAQGRPSQQSFSSQQNNDRGQRRPTQQSFSSQRQFSRNQQQIQNQGGINGQSVSLFDQIQNRIKTQKSNSIPRTQTTPRPSLRRIPTSSIRSTAPPTPRRLPQTRPPSRPSQEASKFGVFESVDLSNSLPTAPTSSNQKSFSDVRSSGPSPPSDGFFGVFQEVDLTG